MAMMVSTPKCEWNACRYHMAEKSPRVQPTRHLKVLTPALRQAEREAQKSYEKKDEVGDLGDDVDV